MAFWPDTIFNLLPGLALFSICTSLFFLFAMSKCAEGFLAAIYTLRAIDLLLGLSLFYAGFHGIFLSVYADQNELMPPIRCLFTAVHLHIWVFTDSAQFLLLGLLCSDQFISVVWTKRHREFSEYYFNFISLLLLLLIASFSLGPAWIQPIMDVDNSTIRVSSYCAMQDAFGDDFYEIQLEIRKWFPILAIFVLFFIGIIICFLQFSQKGRFKWSDNNKQSARFFFLILCRALFLLCSVHIPLLELEFGSIFAKEDRRFLQEILFRTWQTIFFGLIEPILNILFLPQFPAKIGEFFNLNEIKRTWQSADDPPPPIRSVGTSGWDIFGSFHSTTGNILGDAGIPMELNADVQRSVSFYYKDEEK